MAGSPSRCRPFALALIACGIPAAGGAIGYAVASLSSPPTAKRTALARTLKPRGAPGWTLGVSRVVIPPG